MFWKKLFWEFCYIPRNTSTVESISSNATCNSLRILTLNHKATWNYFSNKIDTNSEVRDDSAFQTQDEGWGERVKAFVGDGHCKFHMSRNSQGDSLHISFTNWKRLNKAMKTFIMYKKL